MNISCRHIVSCTIASVFLHSINAYSADQRTFAPNLQMNERPLAMDLPDEVLVDPISNDTSAGVDGIAHGRSVDIEGMGEYTSFVLSGKVVGYALVINENGVPAYQNAGGMARTGIDGAQSMSVHTRNAVASVTKQITAAATLKALGMAGVSVDTAVSSFLPGGWYKGKGFAGNGVTFRQLLTHRSGLYQMYNAMTDADKKDWTNDWDGLQYIVHNGALPGAPYKYKNANFALMRVLIPALWVASGEGPDTLIIEENHAQLYLSFVQQYVLDPAGIPAVSCGNSVGYAEALYYSFDFSEQGGNFADFAPPSCGGNGGLRLSAMELARYLAYLEHSTDILSESQRNTMDDGHLGWRPYGSGDVLYHDGKYHVSYDLPGAGTGAGGVVFVPENATYRKETHACVVKFPKAVEASLVVNSSIAGGGSFDPCDLLKGAFDLYGG